MLEIVISLVADVARKFIQGHHGGSVPLVKVTNAFWLEQNDHAPPIILG